MIKSLEKLELDLDNARMMFIKTVVDGDKPNYQRALDIYRKASDDYVEVKYPMEKKGMS